MSLLEPDELAYCEQVDDMIQEYVLSIPDPPSTVVKRQKSIMNYRTAQVAMENKRMALSQEEDQLDAKKMQIKLEREAFLKEKADFEADKKAYLELLKNTPTSLKQYTDYFTGRMNAMQTMHSTFRTRTDSKFRELHEQMMCKQQMYEDMERKVNAAKRRREAGDDVERTKKILIILNKLDCVETKDQSILGELKELVREL